MANFPLPLTDLDMDTDTDRDRDRDRDRDPPGHYGNPSATPPQPPCSRKRENLK